MKIALAQMEVVPGRPRINVANMIRLIGEAKKKGVDLVAFPEMCVGGYLLGDKWTNEEFCKNLMDFNEEIRKASRGIAVAYGNIFVDYEVCKRCGDNNIHPNKDGRVRKYNAVYVFQDGKPAKKLKECGIIPVGIQPKNLLPTYRIFDDERYFFSLQDIAKDFGKDLEELAQPFILDVGGKKVEIGFELCEDLWCEDYRKNLEALNITKILINNNAKLIVNLSSSPWTYGKNNARDRRVGFLKKESEDRFVPFLYVNCTGVQNNGKNIVTFDGGSTVYNKQGLPVLFAKEAYGQELMIVDEKTLDGKALERKENNKIKQKYDAIIRGIKNLRDINGMAEQPNFIIGLSGGIDSALVASLLVKAVGKEKVFGVNLPTKYNAEKTKNAAAYIVRKLGIKYEVIPIEELVEVNKKILDNVNVDGTGKKLSNLNIENVQAKIRGTSILSNLAAKYGGIFTNNGNKLEVAIGYATLYGDVGGAIAPIADLTKTEVVEMAKFMNKEIFHEIVIPEILFPDELWRFSEEKIQPSAELKDKQIDPMKFGYHCALLEALTDYRKKSAADVMQWYLNGEMEKNLNISLELLERWNITNPEEFIKDIEWFESLMQNSIFKRVQAPPIIITSKSAYGFDIRESMFPYETTLRHDELKKKILAMGKYSSRSE